MGTLAILRGMLRREARTITITVPDTKAVRSILAELAEDASDSAHWHERQADLDGAAILGKRPFTYRQAAKAARDVARAIRATLTSA